MVIQYGHMGLSISWETGDECRHTLAMLEELKSKCPDWYDPQSKLAEPPTGAAFGDYEARPGVRARVERERVASLAESPPVTPPTG